MPSITATSGTSGPERSVAVRAGNHQAICADRPFGAQLTAVVTDRWGRPAPGAVVTFRVVSGPATFGRAARAAAATTGLAGLAVSAVVLAGSRPGPVRITASTNLAPRPATYSLRVVPAPPTGGGHVSSRTGAKR